MPESANIKAGVRISRNELEAYLSVPAPEVGTTYTVGDLQAILEGQGVKFGIIQSALSDIIRGQLYNRPVLVARGIAPVDGVDGYYEYKFDRRIDNKPKIKEDGSVDYMSVYSIESVTEGQVIAVYHPPLACKDGTGVRGNEVLAKRGKEQPFLKGKGFNRSQDNLTYTAAIDGKIEMQNDRIMILSIHEVNGDADLIKGDIDFRGDVVIHGSVESGVNIKATGSITIDGTVEACTLDAGKDIILRRGMLGGNKAFVKTKGNVFARFFENTRIEADGIIQADVLMNCKVLCKEKVILIGNRASIIGGEVHAVEGVEASNIGNDAETKTTVVVGAEMGIHSRLAQLEKKIAETKAEIQKIEKGLEQFKQSGGANADPRRMTLLRIRIRDVASLTEDETEYGSLQALLSRAAGATVRVMNTVYPGVQIVIDDERLKVQNMASNIEFYHVGNKVRTRPAI